MRILRSSAKAHHYTVRKAFELTTSFARRQVVQALELCRSILAKKKKIYRGQAPEFSTGKTEVKQPMQEKKSLLECVMSALAKGNAPADERSYQVAKRRMDRAREEYELAMGLMRQKNREREIEGDGRSIKLTGTSKKVFLSRGVEKGRWKYLEGVLRERLKFIESKVEERRLARGYFNGRVNKDFQPANAGAYRRLDRQQLQCPPSEA